MIILINANILTMKNEQIIENAQIEISGDRISYIGQTRPANGDFLDCHGKLLMPSFVNAHAHGAMVQFLGAGEGLDLQSWLRDAIYPLEAAMSAEDVYRAQKRAVDEYYKNGITTVLEAYFHSKEISRACNERGIRAIVGVSADTNSEDRSALLERERSSIDGPVISYFHSIYAMDESAVSANIAFARKHDLIIHTHLCETLTEVGQCDATYHMSPVKLCEEMGVFDGKCLIAHGVHVDKEDFDILSKYSVGVVSCPASNAKLASGIAPIRSYMSHGINVCLGTDSIVSNGKLSMFREMYLTACLQKIYNADANVISPYEILKMATINGAKALGIEDLGILDVGYLADMILLDVTKQKFFDTKSILSAIIYTADECDIDMTICAGNIVYKKDTQ